MTIPVDATIAAITGGDSFEVQELLRGIVADWRAAGIEAVGLIAEGHGLPDRACGAGFMRDVVSGERFSIYRDTAPADTSCHLDAAGVDAACRRLLPQIASCDLVVLSKFGKLEAGGAGLAPAFQAARLARKPMLTSVSARQQEAWRAFAPDAVALDANAAALRAWLPDIAGAGVSRP